MEITGDEVHRFSCDLNLPSYILIVPQHLISAGPLPVYYVD